MVRDRQMAVPRTAPIGLFCGLLLIFQVVVWAATTGSISGSLKDPSGAVIPGATVVATNTAMGIQNKTTTDAKGAYASPSLQVGRYDVQAEVEGFRPQKRSGLVINADSVLQVDLTVEMIE